MEGHGEIDTTDAGNGQLLNGTLLYQVYDPRTRHEFRKLWDDQTKSWNVRQDIKVWFNEADGGKTDGSNGSMIPGRNGIDYSAADLTVGFGAGGPTAKYGPFFGPELGFGWSLDLNENDNVLIVKTAWGGKSLAHDFRPPSSTTLDDPYCRLPDCDAAVVGHFYQVMIEDVKKLLTPGAINTIYPDLAGRTPKVSGFGWFQGWNDGCNVNDTAAYETNMVNMINDIRTEFNDPYLPVSIAVSGFGGRDTSEESRTPPKCWDGPDATKIDCQSCGRDHHDRECRRIDIILSQQAAADLRKHPELGCCVEAVETRDFWRPAAFSPNHRQDYHFYHNAETHYFVGKAMAEGINKATKNRPINNKNGNSSAESPSITIQLQSV